MKPYVKRDKNDADDAEGIREAVTRPSMRFVAIKSAEQRSVLMPHRTRDPLVRQRPMLINALRAHLAELGQVAPTGVPHVKKLVAVIADPAVFKSGRMMAAWIGLAPRQNSTGAKQRLGRISKQGDSSLRWLLVAGAMSVVKPAKKHGTTDPWLAGRPQADHGRGGGSGQRERAHRLGVVAIRRDLPKARDRRRDDRRSRRATQGIHGFGGVTVR